MEELLRMVVDALRQHIPQRAAWIPFVGIGVLGLSGLVLLVRGAKLAPVASGLAFLGLGGIGGAFVAQAVGVPAWPIAIVAAAVGLGLGLVLFKLWLAILVAVCFAGGGLTLYAAKAVSPHVGSYTSRNLEAEESVLGVALPEAGGAAAAAGSPWTELVEFWGYMSEEVPSFQTSFWAILLSTGLAGLILGLLLPKAARALCAATAGTFCLFVALTGLLKVVWPAALGQLKLLGVWGWVIVLVVWGLSLVGNWRNVRGRRAGKGKGASDEAPAGRAVTA
jgi:hypothetical protein